MQYATILFGLLCAIPHLATAMKKDSDLLNGLKPAIHIQNGQPPFEDYQKLEQDNDTYLHRNKIASYCPFEGCDLFIEIPDNHKQKIKENLKMAPIIYFAKQQPKLQQFSYIDDILRTLSNNNKIQSSDRKIIGQYIDYKLGLSDSLFGFHTPLYSTIPRTIKSLHHSSQHNLAQYENGVKSICQILNQGNQKDKAVATFLKNIETNVKNMTYNEIIYLQTLLANFSPDAYSELARKYVTFFKIAIRMTKIKNINNRALRWLITRVAANPLILHSAAYLEFEKQSVASFLAATQNDYVNFHRVLFLDSSFDEIDNDLCHLAREYLTGADQNKDSIKKLKLMIR
jgi:hypothetical protein